jgi:hypothetical protein
MDTMRSRKVGLGVTTVGADSTVIAEAMGDSNVSEVVT